MTEGVEEIRTWCAASGLTCRDGEDGVLLARLQPDDRTEVRIESPQGTEPLRLSDRVALPSDELGPDRVAEVVEGVVLSRSSLVDARPTPDGRGADVVVIVHAEGLNRHTFAEAVFEIEKLRLLLAREVRGAVAAERTLVALEVLAGDVWAASGPPSA